MEAEGLSPTTAFRRSIQLSGDRSPFSVPVLSGSGWGASALLPAGSVVVMASSASPLSVLGIGVRDIKPLQYSRFKTFHHCRLGLIFMVMPHQMQKTMYDQMDQMIIK